MEATQPLLAHTGWDGARLMYRVSSDTGHTWTKDLLFPMETYGWLPRNLPITLPGGELLVPLSDERDNVSETYVQLPSGRVLGHRVGMVGPGQLPPHVRWQRAG